MFSRTLSFCVKLTLMHNHTHTNMHVRLRLSIKYNYINGMHENYVDRILLIEFINLNRKQK